MTCALSAGHWSCVRCRSIRGSLMASPTPSCPGCPLTCCLNWCAGPPSAGVASSGARCLCCQWRSTASCTSSWRTSTRPWWRWGEWMMWGLFFLLFTSYSLVLIYSYIFFTLFPGLAWGYRSWKVCLWGCCYCYVSPGEFKPSNNLLFTKWVDPITIILELAFEIINKHVHTGTVCVQVKKQQITHMTLCQVSEGHATSAKSVNLNVKNDLWP